MRTIIFVLAGLVFGAIVVAALRHRNADVGEPYYASQMASVEFAATGAAKPASAAEPATTRTLAMPSGGPAVETPPVAIAKPSLEEAPALAPVDSGFDPGAGAKEVGATPVIPSEAVEPAGVGVRRFPPVSPREEPESPEPAGTEGPAGGSFTASKPATETEPDTSAALERPVVADDGEASTEAPSADTLEEAAEEEQVTVYHAGRAVELKSPKGWKVYSFPAGRELWTVLSPGEIKPRSVLQHGLQDGLWLTHHVRSTPLSQRAEEIAGMIAGRLRQNGGKDAVPVGRKERFVDGRPALLYQFEIPADGIRKARQGMHAMIATQWGIVELHFIAFEDDYDQRYVSFMTMLDGMKISAPRGKPGLTDPAAATPDVMPAAQVVGSWKAKRSVMRLYADGRIELQADRTSKHPINSVSFANEPAPEVLKGRFQAQNDVLFVKWEDGSLLNFRWKIFKEALLLTDHEGEVSHLERVLE